MCRRRETRKNEHRVIALLVQRAPGLIGNNRLLQHATTPHLEFTGVFIDLSCSTHSFTLEIRWGGYYAVAGNGQIASVGYNIIT